MKKNFLKKLFSKKMIVIYVIIIALLLIGTNVYNLSKETTVNVDIVDMNSSINEQVDNMLKTKANTPGIHRVFAENYTYVLINSEKTQASEVSIGLHGAVKKWNNVYIKYEVEINENSVSKSNPEKIQAMLIRVPGNEKIRTIEP